MLFKSSVAEPSWNILRLLKKWEGCLLSTGLGITTTHAATISVCLIVGLADKVFSNYKYAQ